MMRSLFFAWPKYILLYVYFEHGLMRGMSGYEQILLMKTGQFLTLIK